MAPPTTGPCGFTAGLAGCAVATATESGLIVYQLEPVNGPQAGRPVMTAVELGEVQRWPAVPPHWIHLPAELTFTHTNAQPSPRAGFVRHSRQVRDWGRDPDPAQAWLSHVRGVIGQTRT